MTDRNNVVETPEDNKKDTAIVLTLELALRAFYSTDDRKVKMAIYEQLKPLGYVYTAKYNMTGNLEPRLFYPEQIKEFKRVDYKRFAGLYDDMQSNIHNSRNNRNCEGRDR